MTPDALQLLLWALAQRHVAVADLAGLPQPVLSPMQLLLPQGSAPARQRAAIAHAAAHLLHSRAGQDARGRKPLALAVLSTVEDARVERLLVTSLPGVRRWFAVFMPEQAPAGLGFAALMARLDRVLADPHAHDGLHWVQRAQQGFWALPADAPPADFAQHALVLANMLGQMRVPFDTQYRPHSAYRDDHSYLWDHGRSAEADPLPAPGDGPAQAPSHAGATDHTAESTTPVLRECSYGEWHDKLGLWRPGWCRVQERAVARPGVAPTVRRRQRPLVSEGETLDLQAAVATQVDRRRGSAWDTRVFRRTLPPARASVLLLLDLSQSTLAPWGGGPSTVQAALQQAALRLAQELTARGARVAVHGFASNGRTEVAYWRAVEFGAPCDAAALAALPVRHSTRLGAALRHAQSLLAEEASPRRSLVLLSDGQPWDIDVYEAEHLLRDARRAVEQLRATSLHVSCIACDAHGLAELRPVFGASGLHLLDAVPTAKSCLSDAGRSILGR